MESHGTRSKHKAMESTTDSADTGGTVVANKPFRMFGIDYQVGDLVDVSHLPDHKIGQLMNQRYLRPAPAIPQPG